MTRFPHSAFAFVVSGVFVLSTNAEAGSTATRCDAQGCIHIHCNATGDRCYRYGTADVQAGHRGCEHCDHRTVHRAEPGAHRLCDSDGDRCYSGFARHWNYRDYYRSLGFHWNGAPERR